MTKKKKKNNRPETCEQCENCVYIGEGDFICTLESPIIIMEDFCPNENYMYCNFADYTTDSEEDFDIDE